jgi:hypothetical protein
MESTKIKEKRRVLINRRKSFVLNQRNLIMIGTKLYSLQQKKMNGNVKRSLNKCEKDKIKKENLIKTLQYQINEAKKVIQLEKEKEDRAQFIRETKEYFLVQSMMEQFKGIQKVVIDALASKKLPMASIIEIATLGEHDKIFQRTSSTLFRLGGITLEECKHNFPNLVFSKKTKTKEHIDGRTNIIMYFYRALLEKEITTIEQAVIWIRRYSVWIHTSDKFNVYVEKFQNDKKNLITVETYVKAYEDFYHVKLSSEEIEKMRYYFLSTTYGTKKFPKEDLIKLIVSTNKPESKLIQIIKILLK